MRGFATFASVAALLAAAPVAAQSWDDRPAPMGMFDDGPPAPPAGAAPNLRVPTRDAAGDFDTPNRGLSAAEATWHLRAALNVAALGCRDVHEPQTVAAYNALLGAKRAVLAGADAQVRVEYRDRHGAAWQDRHDGQMTRVYNFFAQPPAQAAFCAEARRVLDEAGVANAEEFVAAAPAALARLEAPFLAFYDRYDRYRQALAVWQGRGLDRVVVATARPVRVSERDH